MPKKSEVRLEFEKGLNPSLIMLDGKTDMETFSEQVTNTITELVRHTIMFSGVQLLDTGDTRYITLFLKTRQMINAIDHLLFSVYNEFEANMINNTFEGKEE